MKAFPATNRNDLDTPAYTRRGLELTETFITCPECGALASLRLDHMARRYECTNQDCQHAIDARLVEVRNG